MSFVALGEIVLLSMMMAPSAAQRGLRVETLDPLSARWLEGLETSAETLAGALR